MFFEAEDSDGHWTRVKCLDEGHSCGKGDKIYDHFLLSLSLQSYKKDRCSHRETEGKNYKPTAGEWLNHAAQVACD